MIQSIMNKAMSIAVFMLIAALISAIVGLVMAVPVMFLWNWVMPHISGGLFQEISYMRAWGLITLLGILFSPGKADGNKK